jgi:hypothetical protein
MGACVLRQQTDGAGAVRQTRNVAAFFELAQEAQDAGLGSQPQRTPQLLEARHAPLARLVRLDRIETGALLQAQSHPGSGAGRDIFGLLHGILRLISSAGQYDRISLIVNCFGS